MKKQCITSHYTRARQPAALWGSWGNNCTRARESNYSFKALDLSDDLLLEQNIPQRCAWVYSICPMCATCATTPFSQQKPCILNLDPYNEETRWGQGFNEMAGENYSNKFRSQLRFLSIPHHDNFVFLSICRQILLLLRS